MQAKQTTLPGSFYQRAGRWWWAVTLPGEESRRSRPLIPAGFHHATKDRKSAESIARQMWRDAEKRCGQSVSTGKSFPDFRAGWLVHIARQYGRPSNTYTRADLSCLWCLNPAGPQSWKDAHPKDAWPTDPEDLRPTHLEAVLDSWVADGLARTTINQRLQVLKKGFRWAAREGIISAERYGSLTLVDPIRPGVTAAAEPKIVQSVSDADVDATLPHLPQVLQDMVRVHRLTGMRSTELCEMCWARIDATGEIWFYVPLRHKTQRQGKQRIVAIGPQAQKLLEGYRGRPADAPIFTPEAAQTQRGVKRRIARRTLPIQPSQAKRQATREYSPGYDKRTYAQAIEYAVIAARKAGNAVSQWHPHQLRHAAGTRTFITLGQQQASAVLGHSSPDVTRIYIDRDAQTAAQMQLAAQVAKMIG